jgi:hypothetical protein
VRTSPRQGEDIVKSMTWIRSLSNIRVSCRSKKVVSITTISSDDLQTYLRLNTIYMKDSTMGFDSSDYTNSVIQDYM